MWEEMKIDFLLLWLSYLWIWAPPGTLPWPPFYFHDYDRRSCRVYDCAFPGLWPSRRNYKTRWFPPASNWDENWHWKERETHTKFPKFKTGVLPFATRTRHSISRGYFLTIMFSLFLWEENTGTVLLNFPWDPRKLSRRTGELREEARHFSHSRLLLKKMLNGQPS